MLSRRSLPVIGLLAVFAMCCWTMWCAVPAGFAAEESSMQAESSGSGAPGDCRELVGLLEQQKAQLSREFGQIRREIGLLREELGKPGLEEVFAGIGYILGLAGVGLFIHCRKSSGSR
jgi:hypothetical protein